MDIQFRKINEFDQQRLMDNILICRLLEKYLQDHPQIRFGQALWNLGILQWRGEDEVGETGAYFAIPRIQDPHGEEPETILKRMKIPD